MKKMYLMNGLAVAALALATTSCHKDLGGFSYSEEDALANAELQLGVQIDPNQDWKMTQTVSAAITVNGNYGETYTVKVYANDPLAERVGQLLAKGEIANGGTFKSDFTSAKGASQLVVALVTSKGYTTYRTVPVVDGKMEAVFGGVVTRGSNRSATSPEVPHISSIPDADYANSYLEGATEPNNTNVWDNADNSGWKETGESNNIDWNNDQDLADRNTFYGMDWDQRVEWAKEHRPNWVYYWKDDTYVTKFKVMGDYTGNIDVFGRRPTSMYIGNGGTWTLQNGQNQYNIVGQSANAGSVIVVDNGGTLVIPQYAKLDLANEARLVVMPGGRVIGEGEIAVHNGNAAGLEGYNGGTIDVGTFDNNFGKFFNYGTFKATWLKGGAQLSNFYNHSVVHITRTGVKADNGRGNYQNANTRIYNACQWYCEEDMHAYVLELAGGSYFYVGGELNLSDGEDATCVNSYVSMADGALLRAGTLSNNNTSWTGPTDGLAVAELGGITYINWTAGAEFAITSGYIINNIAVSVSDKTIGAGQGQGADTYVALRDYVLNGHGSTGNVFDPQGKTTVGNGNAVLVAQGGADISIPRSNDFVAGTNGCTPGYNSVPSSIDPDPTPDPTPDPDPEPDPTPQEVVDENPIYSYAFEDTHNGDYDMNDVVLKVQEFTDGEGDDAVQKLRIKLVAIGATLNLNIRLYPAAEPAAGEVAHYAGNFTLLEYNNKTEVHDMLGVEQGMMYNTGWNGNKKKPVVIAEIEKGNYDPAALPIAIYSEAQGEIRLAGAGQAPYGVVIPKDWSWPTERTNIETSYNETSTTEGDQSFKNFAERAGESQKWFNHPTNKVMNESSLGYNQ